MDIEPGTRWHPNPQPDLHFEVVGYDEDRGSIVSKVLEPVPEGLVMAAMEQTLSPEVWASLVERGELVIE